MANHRMLSNRIANSAHFLQMPVESQLLYFHMIIRADDDGVVESYPIMKLLGIAPDNFKVLEAKDFIRKLNEDQVVIITHWQEHNIIRADRKVNSIYTDLIKQICPDIPLLEPKSRSDVEDNTKRLNSGLSTDSLRQGRGREDRVSKNNIRKDNNISGPSGLANNNFGEDLKDLPVSGEKKYKKDIDIFKDGQIVSTAGSKLNEAIELFRAILPGDFIGTKTAYSKSPTREAVEALLGRYSLAQIKEIIRKYDEGKTDPYRPNVGTVHEFCTFKLAKVEAYVVKTGGLWAQRSISSPEQAKVREDQYKRVMELSREKTRIAKEKWAREHPNEESRRKIG